MKAHPPVSVGETSAGEPVKRFRCGKCKKVFPKGRGHNARTCGKNTQRNGGVRPAINVSPHTPPGGANRVPSISEVDTLLQQKLEKGTTSRKPQRTVDKRGKVRWTLDGELHNPDGPAVEYTDGTKVWYRHGERHREDGPAVEYANGHREWWVSGIQTEHPGLCEEAILPDLTSEEFYELCTHEDYVVRQLAANNPHCPVEWRVLVDIMDE